MVGRDGESGECGTAGAVDNSVDSSEGWSSESGSTWIGEGGGLCIAERVDEGEGESER